MRLILSAQYQENYGAHDWNGEGECPQYWKMKGGRDYSVDLESLPTATAYEQVVKAAREVIEYDTYYESMTVMQYGTVTDIAYDCMEDDFNCVRDITLEVIDVFCKEKANENQNK